MASPTFQLRFKDRSGKMLQSGDIATNPKNAILKPSQAQMHGSIFKSSANTMVSSSLISPLPKSYLQSLENSYYKQNTVALTEPSGKHEDESPVKKHSDGIVRAKFSQSPQGYSHGYSGGTGYKPYTIKDYNNIKLQGYYRLGGLGPTNVGSHEWSRKKEFNDRRWRYGQEIYYNNAAKIPWVAQETLEEKEVIHGSRRRGLEFAKKVIRPRLKQQTY